MAALMAWSAVDGSLQAKNDKKNQSADPVVMTINGHDIPRSEFLYFYQKNNDAEQVEKKSFDEYVDLFVNFRLKVEEAKSRGIDTTQAYIDELAGYRKDLAAPYLSDKDWLDAAIAVVNERRQFEVHAAHILFSCPQDAAPAQVAEAKAKMTACRRQLEAGAPFDSLARALSEDPSARQNAGDLGYFSALQMVFPFEEAAFTTPVGEISQVRSRFGFHLIKVFDRRPGRGEVIPAHIMLNFRQGMSLEERNAIKLKADSVYRELTVNHRDFGEVAAQVSQDVYTAGNGGKYGWISANSRFPKEWLDVAFGMEKGEISKPFATDYGYHIMTIIDKRAQAIPSEEELTQMREFMKNDTERQAAATKRQLRIWAAEEKMLFNDKSRQTVMQVLADTTLTVEKLEASLQKLVKAEKKKPLLSIGREGYSSMDFAHWLVARYDSAFIAIDAAEELEAWSDELLLAYEDAHLAEKNQEFANIYKEYCDGILLFDVATTEVWDKAANDEEGLKAFFAANRDKYKYATPRFKGAFVECADDEVLIKTLKAIYEQSADYLAAAERVRNEVLTDTLLTPDPKRPRFHIVNGIYSPGDNATVDRDVLHVVGKEVTPKKSMPVQFTSGKVITEPESLADARNTVVADYQDALEEQWVAKLREKFKWSLNASELAKIKAENE